MAIQELAGRIGADGKFRYQLPKINFAYEQPTEDKPLHQFLLQGLNNAFSKFEDTLTRVGPKVKFPNNTNVALRVADGFNEERRPSELFGRMPKPRNHKKAIYILTVPRIPTNIQSDSDLSEWMRGILGKNACHDAIVVECDPNEKTLFQGAKAVISSMEGCVGVETYKGDENDFFDNIAQRLKLLGGAEMVNQRTKKDTDMTFEDWCQKEVVQGIAYASQILGRKGLLWDLNLRRFASRIQIEKILLMLRQAGLGEGNLSGIDKKSKVMAITETGVSKTHINPYKGEVVAVPEVTKNGTVHLVMRGIPEGHPITLFKHPSVDAAQDTFKYLVSAFRRGKVKENVLDTFKKGSHVRIDHPDSIEGHENGIFYMADALYHAGKVEDYEGFVRYLDNGFGTSESLPVIPEDVEVAADAAFHSHVVPLSTSANGIKIVPLVADGFDFKHSPPCGSREAALFLVKQMLRSYELYGLPQSPDEIRIAIMPGHGCFIWGYNGIKNLADKVSAQMKFDKSIPRF